MSGDVAVTGRRTALNRSALTGAAQRLQPLDPSLAQRLAHGDRADLDALAAKQLARDSSNADRGCSWVIARSTCVCFVLNDGRCPGRPDCAIALSFVINRTALVCSDQG